MSSNLETLKDKIHPSKRKTSEKEKEKEKKKEEEEEEDEEEEEEEDEEEQKPVKKEEKKPEKKEEKKPEKKEEKKPEKKPEVKETKKEEKKPEKKEEKKVEKKEEKKEVKKEEEEEEEYEEEEEEEDDEEEQKKKEEKKSEKKDVLKKEANKTDSSPLINDLKKIKSEGDALYNKNSFEEAAKKYKAGYDKLQKELPKIQKEHNVQSDELLTLYKQISSNLSSCYTQLKKYQESIDLDLKIVELDPKFDEAYARLFSNYIKIDKKDQALIHGESLLKFDDDTKKKYAQGRDNVITNISKLKSELQVEKSKNKKCSCCKCFIPLIILIVAVGVYLYLYQKEETLKYLDDLEKKIKNLKYFKNYGKK